MSRITQIKTDQVYESLTNEGLLVRIPASLNNRFVVNREYRFVRAGTPSDIRDLPEIAPELTHTTSDHATIAANASSSVANAEANLTAAGIAPAVAQQAAAALAAEHAQTPEEVAREVREADRTRDVHVDPITVRPGGNAIVVESDANRFLDVLSKGLVLDFSQVTEKPKVVNEPGLLAGEIAKKVGAELKVLCGKVMGNSSPATLTTFLLHVFQLAATFYTSKAAEHKEFDYIETPDGKKIYVEEVFKTINEVCANTGYENPPRQYLGHFTPTIVSAMLNGKITPNEKVMAQHGVPAKFFAYTLDCVRPSYAVFNSHAILAWNLARQQAFNLTSKTTDNTLHNVYQLSKDRTLS